MRHVSPLLLVLFLALIRAAANPPEVPLCQEPRLYEVGDVAWLNCQGLGRPLRLEERMVLGRRPALNSLTSHELRQVLSKKSARVLWRRKREMGTICSDSPKELATALKKQELKLLMERFSCGPP